MSFSSIAQNRISSPYSFFGIGQQTFRGTIENRSMGGLRTYVDSIHSNLRNPASYAHLRLTNYTLGAVYTNTWASTATQEDSYDAVSIEYLSIGIPLGEKAGFNFGVIPFKSVGYNIGEQTVDDFTCFSGEGSINRAYIGGGVILTDQLSLGAEVRYNFGQETNSSNVQLTGVQFGSSELNETDFSGLSANFALHYKAMINDKYEIQATTVFSPESNITADNTRTLGTFLLGGNNTILPASNRPSTTDKQKLRLPSELTVGATLGLPRKWSLGAEYSRFGTSSTGLRSFAPQNSEFTDAASYRLGGFYIPDYNSLSSYWNRVVYRGGLRWEETGLRVNGEDISEFGISFGMGLPIGRRSGFSNANIGFEYGERGATSNNLVKEQFFSVSIGLSLNDRWFRKRKYQ